MRKLKSLLACTTTLIEYTPTAHSSLSSQSGTIAVIASTPNISKQPLDTQSAFAAGSLNLLTHPPSHHGPGSFTLSKARTQYHALREQVQTLARTQHVRDLASKQVGLDPMPEFPIHAIEGNLAPVMPTVLPVQLLPAPRKFHPEELGIRESKPPSQLSLSAIRVVQEKQMQDILIGMRFFGAGIGRSEDILPFFLSDNANAAVERHCPHAKEWLSRQLQSVAHCAHAMAQTLLWIYSLMHREQLSVHIVHIADWEDHAHITTFGDAPAQWTVYCVQFPQSRTFHLDTAAWNCHGRVSIPWQPTPHLIANDTLQIPFHCTNPNCLWFAIPYGPNGQYLISHKVVGTFLYDQCIPCLFSWIETQASCSFHTTSNSYPELTGALFVDNEGNVAVAAAHNWQVDITTGHQTCLIQASIDNRLFWNIQSIIAVFRALTPLAESIQPLPTIGTSTTLGLRLRIFFALCWMATSEHATPRDGCETPFARIS